jgi:hypothetical protein
MSMRVPATGIAVILTIAGDGGPGRPERSPAGGPASAGGSASLSAAAVAAVGGRQDAGPPII